jgi:hypothetical protein
LKSLFLKGTGFSPYVKFIVTRVRALAPEGCFL